MQAPTIDAPSMQDASVVDRLTVLDLPEAFNFYQRRILFALNLTGKHIYAGTVAPAVIAKRRAANKAARIARRAGRK